MQRLNSTLQKEGNTSQILAVFENQLNGFNFQLLVGLLFLLRDFWRLSVAVSQPQSSVGVYARLRRRSGQGRERGE